MTSLPYHWKRGPATARKPREEPELALQIAVKQYLVLCLPADIEWTSSLAGAHLGPSQRAKMKSAGLRTGWPDLQFLIRRRCHFIELKAPTDRKSDLLGTIRDPDLTPDLRRILGAMHPDAWRVCRSVDDVARALTDWGVQLRAMPFS